VNRSPVSCMPSPESPANRMITRVLAALKTLGVTFIRSRIFMGNKGQITWTNQLAANGFKTNAVMGDPTFKAGTPEQLVSLIATSFPNAVHSMEGANEWNLSGRSNWISEVVNHQTRLWNAAKSTAATLNIPVAGPALGMRTGYDQLGSRSSIMDRGTFHLYTGGFVPGYRSDHLIAMERQVCGSKPQFVTETGWHNAPNSKATHNYTPLDVAGTYAPRLPLEYFIRDVPKMSIYELIDNPADPAGTDHEAHFGLLNTDWTPKPAFTALANMNIILKRQYRTTGRAGAPLEFSFREGPSDLRSCLLARSDGRYLLFLWRSLASIYDPNKRIRLTPTTTTAELDWGGQPQRQSLRALAVIQPGRHRGDLAFDRAHEGRAADPGDLAGLRDRHTHHDWNARISTAPPRPLAWGGAVVCGSRGGRLVGRAAGDGRDDGAASARSAGRAAGNGDDL
jgi:hypothetical protein